MDEKIRVNITPYPFQLACIEKAPNLKVESKFAKKFPIKNKISYNLEVLSNLKKKEVNLKPLSERKTSRKFLSDCKPDFQLQSLPENTQLSKTLYLVPRMADFISNESLIHQDIISSTQGYLHAVLYQPRLSTMDRELIIISLEGVIADYSNKILSMRGDAVHTLKELHLRYQVVLVSGWKLCRFLKIMSYLSHKGVYLSGAYKQVGHGTGIIEGFEKKRHQWYLDYNRIYKDFNITAENSKKVLTIIPFMGHPNEIESPHFVIQYTGALRPTFLLNKAAIPTVQYPFTPLTILIPHLAQINYSIFILADTIKALSLTKNFYQAANAFKKIISYFSLQMSLIKKFYHYISAKIILKLLIAII